jgi:hypothetical protein
MENNLILFIIWFLNGKDTILPNAEPSSWKTDVDHQKCISGNKLNVSQMIYCNFLIARYIAEFESVNGSVLPHWLIKYYY